MATLALISVAESVDTRSVALQLAITIMVR
jgi:hypothetical protein